MFVVVNTSNANTVSNLEFYVSLCNALKFREVIHMYLNNLSVFFDRTLQKLTLVISNRVLDVYML